MMDIFLFIHMVIALLLIVVILMQKTGADGLSGIGGGNMGVVNHRTAANFLTKTTIVLAALFMANALLLANLSSKKTTDIDQKIQQQLEKVGAQEETSLPMK